MAFEGLIQKIVEHPTYAPALEKAIAGGGKLVLNYHNHRGEAGWCISICTKEELPIKLLDPGELQELVHIQGFGKTEEDCVPLSRGFSDAFCAHYEIGGPLEVYLNGQPLPTAMGKGGD